VNLRFLETFIWVAKLRSFSLTATKLNTTQANVSARISSLERDLGVRLLDRNGREVSLTAQGKYALDSAEELVRVATEFKQNISRQESIRGNIRIGITDTIALSILPSIIDCLHTCYPTVTVELTADTSLNLSKKLLGNQIEVAFMMGPVIGSNIINKELITLACVWVASPSLSLPEGPIDVLSLANYPILSFPPDSIPYEYMRSYFRRDIFKKIAISTSNSVTTILSLAAHSMGIAALPAVLVQKELAAGNLRRINVTQHFPPLLFHTTYIDAPDSMLPPIVANIACDVAAKYCKDQRSEYAW
jgi:DNA-binding transcriptional LysR family regulator